MEGDIRVEVAWSDAGQVRVESCRLPAGSLVRDALERVSAPSRAAVGIFGERVRQDRVLKDSDRVELYEELPRDPRLARRERARRLRLRR